MRGVIGILCASVLALGSAGCGGDDEEATAVPSACPVHDLGDEVVEFDVVLHVTQQHERIDAMVERFNRSQEQVRVNLETTDMTPADELLEARDGDDDGPALAVVVSEMVETLAADRAIVPIEPCIEADGFDLEPFLDDALLTGQIDGEQWAMPANLAARMYAYDRDAFSAAGLDPDRPPATLAELEAAAAALRAEAGFEKPIWWPTIADVMPFDAAPAEARRIGEALSRLGQGGYLMGEEEAHQLPVTPLAAGRVAIAFEPLSELAGLAAALAQGQAPGRHLAVAGMPGLDEAVTPVFAPATLVLSAVATPAQRAAAWRFVAWLQEPAQQAELHMATDSLPSRPDAADVPALQAYWDELPLLGQAWNAMLASHRAVAAGDIVPGQLGLMHDTLIDIAFEGAPPAERIEQALADLRAAGATFERDPHAYTVCLSRSTAAECSR